MSLFSENADQKEKVANHELVLYKKTLSRRNCHKKSKSLKSLKASEHLFGGPIWVLWWVSFTCKNRKRFSIFRLFTMSCKIASSLFSCGNKSLGVKSRGFPPGKYRS